MQDGTSNTLMFGEKFVFAARGAGVSDDVIVDGRIITAENYDAALSEAFAPADGAAGTDSGGEDLAIWQSHFGTDYF